MSIPNPGIQPMHKSAPFFNVHCGAFLKKLNLTEKNRPRTWEPTGNEHELFELEMLKI